MKKHDLIIMGGGPGGSTLAAYMAKKGYDVGIFEREIYPRFHIGESLLPASMPIFKETGFYETLSAGKYIQKYGARFTDHRGQEEVYFGFQDGLNPEIPMAFEVPRSEFDKDILEHAKKCGATVYQPERVKNVAFYDSHVTVATNNGEYQAKFVADATGRESILGRHFKLKMKNDDLNNVGVFTHYTGVKRNPGKNEGDITIGLLPNQAWSWVIPFKGDRTSVGVVCNAKHFSAGADLGDYLETQMKASSVLQDYMRDAERVQEIQVISNYSHRSETFAGDRWILIGDAATFLDPIFSSGVHVSCTSARFASGLIDDCLKEGNLLTDKDRNRWYFDTMNKGIDRFHHLISMFYNTNFVEAMKKTLVREQTRMAYTSAVAGDMWNDDNIIFKMKVL
ncbi:MAG: NAD(P)/FAD-dependent oxidoreductase [Bdellovibrionia bacterium]